LQTPHLPAATPDIVGSGYLGIRHLGCDIDTLERPGGRDPRTGRRKSNKGIRFAKHLQEVCVGGSVWVYWEFS